MSGESELAAGGHCSYGASDHRQNKNVRIAQLEGQRQKRIGGGESLPNYPRILIPLAAASERSRRHKGLGEAKRRLD
jgi:hypothetical protein